MDSKQAIKRHPSIQPLSREHHQGLMLALKLEKGLKKKIGSKRMKAYLDWFFDLYLLPHFEAEEHLLFPILGLSDPQVIEALNQHKYLTQIRNNQSIERKVIQTFKDLLRDHIRFEERQLFNRIQEVASPEALDQLKNQLQESDFCASWEDEFWK